MPPKELDASDYPDHWTVVRIGDFASVKGGKRMPAGTALVKTPTAHPYLRIVDFKDGRIDKSSLLFVPNEVFPSISRYTITTKDVYISIVGTIGLVGVVDEALDGANLTENAAKICDLDPSVDRDYLAAYLSSDKGQDQIKAQTVGSTQPKLALFRIEDIRVPLPPLPEQKRIAHILGTLDDKIELNRKMNATLEAMARALFKSWFVDFDPVRAKMEGRQPEGMDAATAALFPDELVESELGLIPKGWKIGVLNNLIRFVIGGDWGSTEATSVATVSCYCIRGADIPSLQEGGLGNMPIRFLKPTSLSRRQLQDGDIVIEISGGSPTQSTGRPVLVSNAILQSLGKPLVSSNFCRIVKLKSQSYSKLVYLWLRELYDADVLYTYETGTTGIKNFGFVHFADAHQLAIPNESLVKSFDLRLKSIYARLNASAAESRALSALRDSLLPKLLKGELSYSEATGALEHA